MRKRDAAYGGLGCAGVIIICIAVAAMSFGVWYFGVRTASYFGHGNAQMTAQAAPMQQAVYQRFYQICASIQTNEGQIDALLDVPEDTPNRDYNIAGLQGMRQAGINQYNAEASQHSSIGRGQFQASNLPYRIPNDSYDGSNKTVCEQ